MNGTKSALFCAMLKYLLPISLVALPAVASFGQLGDALHQDIVGTTRPSLAAANDSISRPASAPALASRSQAGVARAVSELAQVASLKRHAERIARFRDLSNTLAASDNTRSGLIKQVTELSEVGETEAAVRLIDKLESSSERAYYFERLAKTDGFETRFWDAARRARQQSAIGDDLRAEINAGLLVDLDKSQGRHMALQQNLLNRPSEVFGDLEVKNNAAINNAVAWDLAVPHIRQTANVEERVVRWLRYASVRGLGPNMAPEILADIHKLSEPGAQLGYLSKLVRQVVASNESVESALFAAGLQSWKNTGDPYALGTLIDRGRLSLHQEQAVRALASSERGEPGTKALLNFLNQRTRPNSFGVRARSLWQSVVRSLQRDESSRGLLHVRDLPIPTGPLAAESLAYRELTPFIRASRSALNHAAEADLVELARRNPELVGRALSPDPEVAWLGQLDPETRARVAAGSAQAGPRFQSWP